MTDAPDFPHLPGQHGLATVRQLREAGFTVAQMQHARKTLWQMPFPGVVAAHRGPLDRSVRVVGAALWAGPRAFLTGQLALQEHGAHAQGPDVATFLVPQTARARTTDLARTVRTHRALPDRDPAQPLALIPAVRALADAAQHEGPAGEDAEDLAIATLQHGLGLPEDLEVELWQRPMALVEGLRLLEVVAHGLASPPPPARLVTLDGKPIIW